MSAVITYIQLYVSLAKPWPGYSHSKIINCTIPRNNIFRYRNWHTTLTNEKKLKIHEYAKTLLVGTPTISVVAKFLGHLPASFEAVTYERLFHRFTEIDKIIALKLCKVKLGASCVQYFMQMILAYLHSFPA